LFQQLYAFEVRNRSTFGERQLRSNLQLPRDYSKHLYGNVDVENDEWKGALDREELVFRIFEVELSFPADGKKSKFPGGRIFEELCGQGRAPENIWRALLPHAHAHAWGGWRSNTRPPRPTENSESGPGCSRASGLPFIQ
jgi:hypothetical protein